MVDGKTELRPATPATVVALADAAVQAVTSDSTLSLLRRLANPVGQRKLQDGDAPAFADTAMPAWEIQAIGAVRRAGRYGNLFLDALDQSFMRGAF